LDFLFSFSFLFFWRAGGIEGSRVFFLFGYHLNFEESSSTGTLLHYYLDLYLFEGKKNGRGFDWKFEDGVFGNTLIRAMFGGP
jgi:hypothetical protein